MIISERRPVIAVMLVFGLAALVIGAGAAETPAGFRAYASNGITFYYPAGWYQMGYSWEPDPEWGVCLSAGSGNEPGVFVLRYSLGSRSLKDFAVYSQESGYGTGFSSTSPVETVVNGMPAYTYHYQGMKYGESVEGDTLIVSPDGTRVYWVDCFALQSEYAANKASFQTLFDSFAVVTTTPVPTTPSQTTAGTPMQPAATARAPGFGASLAVIGLIGLLLLRR